MSDIETLLKQHVGNVDKALEGFEGKVTSVADLVTALNTRLDAAEAKGNREMLGGGGSRTAGDLTELKVSDNDRKEMANILRGKSMSIASDGDGGYLVPNSITTQIESLVRKQSPMRQLAKAINLPNMNTGLPVNRLGATGGWVGEGDTRGNTSTPQLDKIIPPGGTLYALPSLSEELIDDAVVNIEAFLTENVVDVLAENESMAFISGDGLKKPKGWLAGSAPVATADDTRAFGTIQYVPTGAAAALGTDPTAALVSMIFATKAGYRQAAGCAWTASTGFLATIANLKDGQGRPLYTPSLREGVPGVLLGYPVVEFEHMDSIGAGKFPCAFGNWQRGYVIGDRTELTVLRDPYSIKGLVLYYFRKRVHGALLNSEAIKVLKVAAT